MQRKTHMPFIKNNNTMKIIIAMLFCLVTLSIPCAGQTTDLDAYKLRVAGSWWFSQPTGSFHAAGNNGSFDLSKDFDFGSYSTFTGKIDWHFKRKHHFIMGISPVTSDKTVVAMRDIEFQGVTYHAGAQVTGTIQSLSFSPGYQYDIIRRNRGFLGFAAQVYMLNTTATLKGIGTLNDVSATRSTSGSVFAPLPTIGPQFRWYPLHSFDRLSLDGFLQGMYFFGYGDFLSTRATLGVRLHPHLNLRAGYQMGTDLSIHGTNDRLGVRLVQKGPVAGIEGSW